MSTFTSSIIRASTREENEPLNILIFHAHERYQSFMARTGHNFFCLKNESLPWNEKYAPIPDNFSFVPLEDIPIDIDFDLVLCPIRARFNEAKKLAHKLHLPILYLEVFVPSNKTSKETVLEAKRICRGQLNVFLDDNSRKIWGWTEKDNDYMVIRHGIDTDTFKPSTNSRKKRILSVVNKWVERNWSHGYTLWKEATQDLPVYPLGDTPGVSHSVPMPELIKAYQESEIYINTTLEVSIPTALLEAMSCGCAIVTTSSGSIPEFIQHGENALISKTNDPKEIKEYLNTLLNDSKLARRLGEAARETILKEFSLEKFTDNWNKAIRKASEIPFLGE